MKKLLSILAVCLALSGCASNDSNAAADDDTLTIGIVQHLTIPAIDSAREGFIDYLEDKDIKVKFIEKNAQQDNATNDIITKQFVSDGVDLIYAITTPSAIAAANATSTSNIPVIFNAVTDGVDAGLVKDNEKPGGNITGVSDVAPLEKQVELIQTFLPNAKKIGMIYNIGEPNGKLQVEQVEQLAPKFGLTVEKKGISQPSEIATAAQQLAASCDCFYNITDNMIASATATIADKANAAGIPVFGAEEGPMKYGLLASDSINYQKLGEQAGAIAYDILVNKKNPGDIAVQTQKDTKLVINKRIAKDLNITIPDVLLNRAILIED